MTGRCSRCSFQTMALSGPSTAFSRALPSPGYRLGWIIEGSKDTELVCYRCTARALNYSKKAA